jgi:hyperosmotically inducible periplasmic protein
MKPTTTLLALLAAVAIPCFQPAFAADKTAGETVDDSVIATSTKGELAAVGPNVASAINVEVNKGRVQLVGFLDSDKQRADALAAAKKVKGHTAVIDGIVVMPGTRSVGTTIDDQTIQTKVKAAIAEADGWEKGLSINTECKNGEVLLGGFVGKQSHRDAAGKAAAAVPGVKKVHDFLTVK